MFLKVVFLVVLDLMWLLYMMMLLLLLFFIIVSIMLFDLLKRVGKCLLVLFVELVLDLFVKWFKFYISNIFDILKCSVENFFNSYVYCFY